MKVAAIIFVMGSMLSSGTACQRPTLVCGTHEDCPNPQTEFCVEANSSVDDDECNRGFAAEETKCVGSAPSDLAGCQCVVGRAPRHFDGGTRGIREGLACFDFPFDAGPGPDAGFHPGQLLVGEEGLFRSALDELIATRIQAAEGAAPALLRRHVLGLESYLYDSTGLTDRVLAWVEYDLEGVTRFGLGTFVNEPDGCSYRWNDVADPVWTPWTSFPARPSEADIAAFLGSPHAFSQDREDLFGALRLDDRWRVLLGFDPPFRYVDGLQSASLDCS